LLAKISSKNISLTERTKAHIALAITNLFFAINFTAVKFLINGGFLKSFGLNLIRVGVTSILLWILFLFNRQKKTIQKKDYGRLFLCAITGVAINQLFFIKGLSLTYSIHASLLLLTTPILITFIAAWLLKEKINSMKLIGLGLGVAGAMILILSKNKTGNPSDVLLGDIFIILNAISYTFYFVLVKPLMKEYNPIAILRMIFTIGFFMILPFCFNEFIAINWQMYSVKEFFILGIIVFGGTFIAYLFNIYGIKILGASTAGSYIYSQPIIAAIIAISFLGEELALYKILAGVLIFSGVYLANKQTTNG
jgi:drug/metabolite transporter (DMT)-like permease